MIRDIDFVNYYLPPYLQEYKEVSVALKAQEPEFLLIWKAADRVLYNHFISTADEYGIARFEKLLKITPYATDTLEERRERVQSRWFKGIPYTMKMLINKLVAICGENDFSITGDFTESYTISLFVNLSGYGQIDEVNDVMSYMIPENMTVVINNNMSEELTGIIYTVGATVQAFTYTVSSPRNKEEELTGCVYRASATVETVLHTISSPREKEEEITGNVYNATGIVTEIKQSIK